MIGCMCSFLLYDTCICHYAFIFYVFLHFLIVSVHSFIFFIFFNTLICMNMLEQMVNDTNKSSMS